MYYNIVHGEWGNVCVYLVFLVFIPHFLLPTDAVSSKYFLPVNQDMYKCLF
jgi:hypothetical protein